MKKLIVLMLLTCSTAFAAVHPTRAQAAYFDEHDKCVSTLRAAKKDAKRDDRLLRKSKESQMARSMPDDGDVPQTE